MSRGGVRVAVSAVLLVAVALVAAGAVAVLTLLPDPAADYAASAPTAGGSVRVTAEPYTGVRQVSVRSSVAEASTLTTSQTGRVTASSCRPGDTVVSGEVVLVVDDRPVIALATTVPLWRDLRTGARGDDVRALQAELARLDHDLEPDGDYGPATRAAVRDVQDDAGVLRPDGALAAPSVVWLPSPTVTVSECLLHVGDRADDGTVAKVAGGLTALTVVDPPGEGRVLRFDGLVGAVDADGVVTDPELLGAVEQSEMFRQAQGEGTDRLTMALALAEEIDVAVVPPSAVAAAGDGLGCIQSSDGQMLRVEVMASALGQTMVQLVDDPMPSTVRARPDDVAC